jgi:hypothetical protein
MISFAHSLQQRPANLEIKMARAKELKRTVVMYPVLAKH